MSGAVGLLWDGWTNQAVWAEFVAKEANEDLVRMNALCAERGIPEGPQMYRASQKNGQRILLSG